jgi:chemotaxis protein MotB
MINKILITLVSISILASCVSQNKYDRLLKDKVMLEASKAECEDSLSDLRTKREQLTKDLAKFMEDNGKMKVDTARLGRFLRENTSAFNDLKESYEKLYINHRRLLDNSAAESNKLSKDLSARERELMDAEARLRKERENNENLSTSLKERERKVNELQEILAQKDKAVNDLKNKVQQALLSFNSSDLTVNVKNGKVYVSLQEQLLFKSGSAAIDTKGADAIKKLAKVLNENPDINVMVEGHTDDVPMKGSGAISDNWDLSVMRALSIVRILQKENVAPTRLLPSGRSEYMPLDASKTKDARTKNRRTEIILTPKLDELLKLLGEE